jgi:hypothetical protein
MTSTIPRGVADIGVSCALGMVRTGACASGTLTWNAELRD